MISTSSTARRTQKCTHAVGVAETDEVETSKALTGDAATAAGWVVRAWRRIAEARVIGTAMTFAERQRPRVRREVVSFIFVVAIVVGRVVLRRNPKSSWRIEWWLYVAT